MFTDHSNSSVNCCKANIFVGYRFKKHNNINNLLIQTLRFNFNIIAYFNRTKFTDSECINNFEFSFRFVQRHCYQQAPHIIQWNLHVRAQYH